MSLGTCNLTLTDAKPTVGIRDRDWGLGLGLGIGIGNWDLELGI